MEFTWTAEQLERRQRLLDFARDHLNGAVTERDSAGTFDRDLWSLLAGEGVFGSSIPVGYGGQGLDVLTTVLMLEGLGYGCRDNGLTLAVNGQIWTVQEPIQRFGSDAQKSKYLPGFASGDLIGAHAITEASSGSDTYSMETTAEPGHNGYVLNGSKSFIGMAPVSDVVLLFAKTNPEVGRWGITAFLVDKDTEGLILGEARPKMGLRTNPLGDITLEDCWVPETARLGPEGAGGAISSHSFEWERSLIFSSHVGSMERQLDETVTYARGREQFGKPIGQFQSVSNRIADMKLRLEISKLLLYRAAWLMSNDTSAQMESALTKLYLAEAFAASSMDSVRVHGGSGYVTEYEVERDLRDAVGGVIYGGTSDIQRQVVARLLGL